MRHTGDGLHRPSPLIGERLGALANISRKQWRLWPMTALPRSNLRIYGVAIQEIYHARHLPKLSGRREGCALAVKDSDENTNPSTWTYPAPEPYFYFKSPTGLVNSDGSQYHFAAPAYYKISDLRPEIADQAHLKLLAARAVDPPDDFKWPYDVVYSRCRIHGLSHLYFSDHSARRSQAGPLSSMPTPSRSTASGSGSTVLTSPKTARNASSRTDPHGVGQKGGLTLADFISESTVSCQLVDTDRYGRIVANCHVRGLDIDEWLVSEGWAWPIVTIPPTTSALSKQSPPPVSQSSGK